jgi:hypothetical protein
VSVGFDPPNGDAEARSQLTEENDFVGPTIAVRGCGAEARPHRYPQLARRSDLSDIAPATFRSTTGEKRKGRH